MNNASYKKITSSLLQCCGPFVASHCEISNQIVNLFGTRIATISWKYGNPVFEFFGSNATLFHLNQLEIMQNKLPDDLDCPVFVDGSTKTTV